MNEIRLEVNEKRLCVIDIDKKIVASGSEPYNKLVIIHEVPKRVVVSLRNQSRASLYEMGMGEIDIPIIFEKGESLQVALYIVDSEDKGWVTNEVSIPINEPSVALRDREDIPLVDKILSGVRKTLENQYEFKRILNERVDDKELLEKIDSLKEDVAALALSMASYLGSLTDKANLIESKIDLLLEGESELGKGDK